MPQKFLTKMADFGGVLLVLSLGLASMYLGFVPGVLAAMSILGTQAVLPRHNALVFWPVGLFISLVVLYVVYFGLWAVNFGGMTTRSGIVTTAGLSVSFAFLSVWRRSSRSPSCPQRSIDYPGAALLLLVNVVVLGFGFWNYYLHPESMIGNYLAGGDHGLHVEFIVDLIKGSPNLFFSNPFSLQDYPRGVHFLLANLLVIGRRASTDSDLVQRHLVPAIFEYVQLAAVAHLVVLGALRVRVQRTVSRAVWLFVALLSLVSIPKLVNHLFWSGFTTSLALCWILFLPLAVNPSDLFWAEKKISTTSTAGFWLILAGGVWIVYPPYVLVPLSIVLAQIIEKIVTLRTRVSIDRVGWISVVLVVVFVALGATAPLLIQGSDSMSYQRLILFGVCWRISLYAVIGTSCVGFAAWALSERQKSVGSDAPRVSDIQVLFGVFSLMVSMMFIAAYISPDFTLHSPPYYVQKMFWVTFFVACGLVLKWLVPAIESTRARVSQHRRSEALVAVVGVIAILPQMLGSSPRASLDRISIDWFAKNMYVDMSDVRPYRAAVFNTWENLGAHVGNIAIRYLTPTYLPIDIAQSRNPILACWYMRQQRVNVVYTASGQSLDLVRSGCDQFANYVESGVRVGPLILETPEMVVGKTVRFSSTSRGPRFLSTGFSEPQYWGTMADGFNSSIQMRPAISTSELIASFDVQVMDTFSGLARIDTFVNGIRKNSLEIDRNRTLAELQVPQLYTNDVLSFQFVCDRTLSEVLIASTSPEQRWCLEVRTLRIGSLSN